ncbi:MAG: hypothetical protein JNM81_14190, partial [Rhodospirillaceae bacterium]|nr:hypothetical protein [Rhodospirillaceae bacterium]
DEADADGNGTLTKTELEDFVTSKGGTATQADAAYTALDTNGTGSVTKEQLVAATESLKALNKPEAPPSEPPSETSRARADLAPWLQFVDALATATKSTSSVAVAA